LPTQIPEIVALKKIYMDQTITHQKMQNVNKEAQILRNLEHKCFIKSYYSFFDQEKVKVKYLNQPNSSAAEEYRWVFCILMEYA